MVGHNATVNKTTEEERKKKTTKMVVIKGVFVDVG